MYLSKVKGSNLFLNLSKIKGTTQLYLLVLVWVLPNTDYCIKASKTFDLRSVPLS